MLVFFGTGSSKPMGYTSDLLCPHCEQENLIFSCYIRYFHIFWIPAFPLGKVVDAVCPHCNKYYDKYNFPPRLEQGAASLKENMKYSPKYFVGMILIIAFVYLIGR